MTTFILYQGQSAVVSWDCDSGTQSLLSSAHCRNDRAVLDETEPVSFELTNPKPGIPYAIQIGEMWISEFLPDGIAPEGMRIRDQNFWAEHPYFESARGLTPIRLYTRCGPPERMELQFEGAVFVLPSKIGEECYNAMSADLARLSKSLLSDLHGKSRRTFELKHSRALRHLHSKEEELQAIRSVCPKIERLLSSISKHPSFKVHQVQRHIRFSGQKPVSARTLSRIARTNPQIERVAAGVNIIEWITAESFDIPEHRFLKAFLMFLRSRAEACAAAARRHIVAIEKDRPYRDASPVGRAGKPTLYQTQDLPIMARLQTAIEDAEAAGDAICQMLCAQLMSKTKAQFVPVQGGMFSRSTEYRELEGLMLRHLRHHAQWVEGDSFNNIGKLTSTLYEQWCYLMIVDAFRDAGVQLSDWNGNIDDVLKGRFTIDFARGLRFESEMTPSLRLRISYQPWIHNLETARRLLSPLYRGGTDVVSWSPDIVLEVCTLQNGSWAPVYAVVLDSKYSRRIRDDQWSATGKYLEIRATHNRRQVCRQLWLMAPAAGGAKIRSNDPDVTFDETGPSIEADETVRFALCAVPAPEAGKTIFAEFARGMLEFLKSRFSTS